MNWKLKNFNELLELLLHLVHPKKRELYIKHPRELRSFKKISSELG
jgi:hypothetical protein